MLAKVWLVYPKFVPKSLVVTQLGGARQSWTVPVFLLRSADWNAHFHDVPAPPEDPKPANGNPHPLYGVDITVEQQYQQQLNQWLQLNQTHNANYNNQGHGHQHNAQEQVLDLNVEQQMAVDAVDMVMDPQVDPPVVNFQAILAEQGVPFLARVPPPI